jgi:hypothetical protein
MPPELLNLVKRWAAFLRVRRPSSQFGEAMKLSKWAGAAALGLAAVDGRAEASIVIDVSESAETSSSRAAARST